MSRIGDANKEINDALAWVGTEIINFQNAGKELEGINLDTLRQNPEDAKQRLESVKQHILAYAGRSEARAKREENSLEKALDKLLEKLPEKDKRGIKATLLQIKMDENMLTQYASRYTGKVRKAVEGCPDAIGKFAAELELTKKDPESKTKKAAAQLRYNTAVDLLKIVKNEVSTVIKWGLALDINLKRAQTFLARMQAKYPKAA